jgi:PIN domain nuclease of toxin-antitoxin system
MEVLIDTHVFAWSLIEPDQINPYARSIIEGGATVYVPPCVLHEIALKVRKGKWSEMADHVPRLSALCEAQGFEPAPYTWAMALRAGSMDWNHADPFDRMIGATAVEMAVPLISADVAFDKLDDCSWWHGRIWTAPTPDDEPCPS